jgi:hypothetical protein
MMPHKILADAIEAWLENEIVKGTPPHVLGDELAKGLGLGIRCFVAAASKRGHEDRLILEITNRSVKTALFAVADKHTEH